MDKTGNIYKFNYEHIGFPTLYVLYKVYTPLLEQITVYELVNISTHNYIKLDEEQIMNMFELIIKY